MPDSGGAMESPDLGQRAGSPPAGEVYDWYVRGRELLNSGDAAAAVQVLTHTVAADPDSRSAREMLARAQFDSHQYPEAAANFAELVARDPVDHYAHFGLGLASRRLGDLATAVEHFGPGYGDASGPASLRTRPPGRSCRCCGPKVTSLGSPGTRWAPFAGCNRPLAESFDVALLDLDGVVYRGEQPVIHAPEALAQARELGMRLAFVTNNALKPPEQVAQRIRNAGVDAQASAIATSAQAAARLLAEQLPEGSRVLVAGGEGLRLAVQERGMVPVSNADDNPAAVVSGYDPELGYARLAEAALAIRHGALWIASNTDATVPTERGLLPGNGALVAFLAAATEATPQVAGKPERALHEESIARSHSKRPLVVGDRLDTDIEGANRAGAPSLLVLTGVATLADLLRAKPEHRPTFLAEDLRGLLRSAPAVTIDASAATASCAGWSCHVSDGLLEWTGEDLAESDGLDAFRAATGLLWGLADAGSPPSGTRGRLPAGCQAFEGLFD